MIGQRGKSSKLLGATVLCAVLVLLSFSAIAGAAHKKREVKDETRATSRLAGGGEFVVRAREISQERIRVVVAITVNVRSRTRLEVSVSPCRSADCSDRASGEISLRPGLRKVRFSGVVPVLREVDGDEVTEKACIFAAAVDEGRSDDRAERVRLKRARDEGKVLCLDVGPAPRS